VIYAIGDTVRIYYDAYKLASGINIQAFVLKPDETKNTYINLPEVLQGADPDFRGIYYLDLIVDQDGTWLIRFDAASSPNNSRPESFKIIIDTALKGQLLKINSAEEIDQELTLNHGSGPWNNTSSLTKASPYNMPI
jgi:hypothetical protein